MSQHCQLGVIPPPPFLSISPLESMRSGGAIPPPPPPPQKGYLSDTRAIPYENKANGCYLERVLRDRGGVISHWAANFKGGGMILLMSGQVVIRGKVLVALVAVCVSLGAALQHAASLYLRRAAKDLLNQQTRVYPYPLGAGSARPNPKMGSLESRPRKPFISRVFCAQRGF